MKILILLLALLFPSLLWGAAAYDKTTTAQNGNTTGLILGPHTITGTNNVLLCDTHIAAGNPEPDTIDFGGFLLSSVANTSSGGYLLRLWSRVFAAGDTQSITVTFPSASAGIVNCSSFSGVDQGTPLGTPQTLGGGFSTGITVTVLANGLGYDVASDDAGATTGCTSTPAVSGGDAQTERFGAPGTYCISFGAGDDHYSFGSTITSTALMSWSPTGFSGYQAQIAVPINAAVPPATLVRHQPVTQ